MKCPKLTAFFCNAGTKLYEPSLFQREEYCCTPYHHKCPFYRQCLIPNEDAADAVVTR